MRAWVLSRPTRPNVLLVIEEGLTSAEFAWCLPLCSTAAVANTAHSGWCAYRQHELAPVDDWIGYDTSISARASPILAIRPVR